MSRWITLGALFTIILAACSPTVTDATPSPEADEEALATVEAQPETELAETEEDLEEPTAPEPTADRSEAEAESSEAATADTETVADTPTSSEDCLPESARFTRSYWPNTNFCQHSVDYSEILSGGPPPDGIPAIDEPKFVAVDEADEWLHDFEPMISLQINGDVRAYPLQIMTWHEIVNDTVGERPVAVTFCPLCNAAIVFDREVDGQVLDFGTSGNLRNSDLIMYDRQTQSWWQQFTGEGIVGEYTGTRLTFLPAAIVSWADFKAEFPDGRALSRDTGYNRNYGVNPYAGYDRIDSRPFLYVGEIDGRLPPMARVAAIELGDTYIAYPFNVLEEIGVANDAYGSQNLVVFWKDGTASALDEPIIEESKQVGSIAIFDRELEGQLLTFSTAADGLFADAETGSLWNIFGQAVDGPLTGSQLEQLIGHEYFWFAWAAFRPDTIIYSAG